MLHAQQERASIVTMYCDRLSIFSSDRLLSFHVSWTAVYMGIGVAFEQQMQTSKLLEMCTR